MATSQATADYILEQTAKAGHVSIRKMFGEYAVYCDGKMVASICDDQLFVKPTVNGRAFIGSCDEAPPYPGAKPQLVIPADRWDDQDWLIELIKITTTALPMPKAAKKPKI